MLYANRELTGLQIQLEAGPDGWRLKDEPGKDG
jgi:hypothetical protein